MAGNLFSLFGRELYACQRYENKCLASAVITRETKFLKRLADTVHQHVYELNTTITKSLKTFAERFKLG